MCFWCINRAGTVTYLQWTNSSLRDGRMEMAWSHLCWQHWDRKDPWISIVENVLYTETAFKPLPGKKVAQSNSDRLYSCQSNQTKWRSWSTKSACVQTDLSQLYLLSRLAYLQVWKMGIKADSLGSLFPLETFIFSRGIFQRNACFTVT